MTLNNNDARKTGIVVCFLAAAMLMGNALSGCDMSAFVQSDFAARCQLLLDLCDKAVISYRVRHPDTKKHAGNLSREWVRFYLAHGMAATRPPSLEFIATTTWESAINDLGISIAAVTRGDFAPGDYELTRVKIGLLKNPQGLETAHKALAKSSNLNASGSIEWLENEFIGPGSVFAEHLQQSPELLARLETSASDFYATAARIDAMVASEPAEVVEAFSRSFKEMARGELRFWQRLLFFN